MATLERSVRATIAYTASDASQHAVSFLPAIPVGSVILITGMTFYSSSALSANATTLFLTDNGTSVSIFKGAITSNDANSVISPSAPVVAKTGANLIYIFNNANAGNLTITIFYRLIPAQANANSIIYSSEANDALTGTQVILTNATTDVMFVKCVIINNFTTSNVTIGMNSVFPLATRSITGGTTSALITKDQEIFLLPTDSLYINGVTAYDYHISYYYDQLYV